MKGGTCAGGGRDGIGAQDPLRRPDGSVSDLFLTGPTNIVCKGEITDEALL